MRFAVAAALALALVLALAAGAVLFLPRLVDGEAARAHFAAQVEALTGHEVTVAGPIDLRLLPRPHLSLSEASLANRDGARQPVLLQVDRLDLQIAFLPLLAGALEVREARLVRPVLELERLADGSLTWPLAGQAEPSLPLRELRLDRLRIIDGQIGLEGILPGGPQRLAAVELDLSAGSTQGPFTLDGTAQLAGETLRLRLEVGRFDDRGSAGVRLALDSEGGLAPDAGIGFRGLVRLGEADRRLRGELTLAAPDPRALVLLLDRLADATQPALPGWLAQPASLRGRLDLGPEGGQLDELRAELAGGVVGGRVALERAPAQRFSVALEGDRLVLPDLAAAAAAMPGWSMPPPGWPGTVDLALGALELGEGTARRLRLRLAVDEAGEVAVEQASAMLPGDADLAFTGRLADGGEGPRLRGRLRAGSDNFRALLAWLGRPLEALPAERLRTFSLEGELVAGPESLSLHRAELRLDATQLGGSLALVSGPRTRLALAASANRLNLDAYLPQAIGPPSFAALREAIGEFDAAVDLAVERLTWRGLLLDGLRLKGELDHGLLTVEELSASDLAEASGHLVGSLDLEREGFDVALEFQAERPARLARALGYEPPAALLRFAPLRISGTARGTIGAADVDLDLQAADTRLALAGQIAGEPAAPRLDLDFRLEESQLVPLLRRLGALGLRDEDFPGPLRLEGHLRAAPHQPTTARLAAELGPMRANGALSWQQGEARPRLGARVVADPLDLRVIEAVLAALEVDPATLPTFSPAWLGAWPREPLDWTWLGALDADIEIGARELRHGGGRLPGLALELTLEDRRLALEHLLLGLDPGELRLSGHVDGREPVPEVRLGVDLTGVDAAVLLERIGAPATIAGPSELQAELTTGGRSLYDLVGGLHGEAELRVRDGRIEGVALGAAARALAAPPERAAALIQAALAAGDTAFTLLGGPFEVRRGVLASDSLGLALDGGEARIAGTLDLLLWMADLRLTLMPPGGSGAGFDLHLLGPLDRVRARPLLDGVAGDALPEPLPPPAETPAGDAPSPAPTPG